MNITLKKLLRLFVVGAISLLLTLLALAAFSRLITPKGSIESFYDEPKNTIDALFIGSSHCVFSASPIDIYKKSGIRSYNISTGCQPTWVTYHYFQEALKYQTPKVVFLEVFGAFYGMSYSSIDEADLVDARDSDRLKPSLNLFLMNMARRYSQATPTAWYNTPNITKYHSRITELVEKDFSVIFNNDYSTAKGFSPMLTQEAFEGFVAPVTTRREPLYSKCEEYIIKTIELAKRNNIDIVLFKTPYITTETDMAMINTISDLAAANNVPFLNFSNDNSANIDFSTDMGDLGHVNIFGAQKLSAVLADYLITNYPQLSSLAPNELWDKAVEVESADFIQVEFRMSQKFTQLMQVSRKYDNVDIIISAQGALSAADYTVLKEKLGDNASDNFMRDIESEKLLVINSGLIYTGERAQERLMAHEVSATLDENGASVVRHKNNERNYSRGRDGLNIMLYDNATSTIFHSFSYAKEHNFDYYTS